MRSVTGPWPSGSSLIAQVAIRAHSPPDSFYLLPPTSLLVSATTLRAHRDAACGA